MENFDSISACIKARRSCKPALMNGGVIPDETIMDLLRLADWAPTHAMTEPWRFIVFSGESLKKYAQDEADLYKKNTPAEHYNEATYQKIIANCAHISHLVIVYMKRGHNPKITVLEEVCATAAAVENLLLGASAAGIAALWSTGAMTFSPALKDYFQLGEQDQIIGQLFLGYSDSVKQGTRVIPLEEKILWKK